MGKGVMGNENKCRVFDPQIPIHSYPYTAFPPHTHTPIHPYR